MTKAFVCAGLPIHLHPCKDGYWSVRTPPSKHKTRGSPRKFVSVSFFLVFIHSMNNAKNHILGTAFRPEVLLCLLGAGRTQDC